MKGSFGSRSDEREEADRRPRLLGRSAFADASSSSACHVAQTRLPTGRNAATPGLVIPIDANLMEKRAPWHTVSMKLLTVGIEQLEPSPLRTGAARPSAALLAAVSRHGPVEPPVVRTLGPRRYEILVGVETWMAVQRAGRHSLAVCVRDDLTDAAAAAVAAAGDTSLDPVTDAERLQALLDAPGEPRSVSGLARVTGRERSSVAHALRLLRLPSSVRREIRAGRLGAGHGKALLGVASDEERSRLARVALRRRWSVRRLEAEIRGEVGGTRGKVVAPAAPPAPAASVDPDVVRLEEHVGRAIGSRVAIDPARATLTIHYVDLEILEGIIERLVRTERKDTAW